MKMKVVNIKKVDYTKCHDEIMIKKKQWLWLGTTTKYVLVNALFSLLVIFVADISSFVFFKHPLEKIL